MSRSFGATELTIRPSMRISPSLTRFQAGDHGEQRRLAAAGRADERDELARLRLEIDALQHLDRAEALGEPRDGQRRHVSLASFDGALGQSANEILAAEEIDQERRNARRSAPPRSRHRRRARSCRLVESATSAAVIGCCVSAGEDDAEQEFVPDAGELPDHGDDQDRRRQRQDDLEEDAPEAGAVDARRLDEIVGNVDVVVAAEQRRERQPLDAVDENQAVDRVREMRARRG